MPFKPAVPKIKIKHAAMFAKNFSGKKTDDGKRSFCVYLNDLDNIRYKEEDYVNPEEFAQALRLDGWNVKQSKYDDDDGNPQFFIPVEVRFDPYPPEVLVHVNGKDVEYTEEMVGALDKLTNFDIIDAYVSIRPRVWDDHGNFRVKAFLNKLELEVDDD